MKVCKECKIEKDITCFHKNKGGKYGVKSICAECKSAYNKIHYKENTEKTLLRSKNRYKEKKDIIKEQHKKYQKANKDLYSRARRKRRASQAEVEENFTSEQAREAMERFNHKCFNCDSEDKLHIDHHRPLSKGYALTPSNAVILCEDCNLTKHAKNQEDFYDKDKYEKLENKLRSI